MYDKESLEKLCNKYEEVITAHQNKIAGLENQIEIQNKLIAAQVELIDLKDEIKEQLTLDNYSLLTKWSKTHK